jgi:hypothetical protein
MTTSPDSGHPGGPEIQYQPTILKMPEGSVEVLPLPNRRFEVTLRPSTVLCSSLAFIARLRFRPT